MVTMTRINYIYPLVGDPREYQDLNEFDKLFQEGKSEFIQTIISEFTNSTLQGIETEFKDNDYSYYWSLLVTLNELNVPLVSIVNFLSKHLDSRFKNTKIVKLPRALYLNTKALQVFNRMCYEPGLNCMFKDFDTQEVKWLTQAASKIIKTGFDKASVSEQILQSPAGFRDLIINSIKLIRTQHANHLSFYDFELSKLNFILENEKVINWTKVLNDYGRKEVIK
jgi:hypothetical protein